MRRRGLGWAESQHIDEGYRRASRAMHDAEGALGSAKRGNCCEAATLLYDASYGLGRAVAHLESHDQASAPLLDRARRAYAEAWYAVKHVCVCRRE